MLVRNCDICGIQAGGNGPNDKDFISLPIDFKLFSTRLDFCPMCWAKYGAQIVDRFSKKEETTPETNSENASETNEVVTK